MVKYRLYVSTERSGQIIAFDGRSINQCYKVAQCCYGKGVICEIIDMRDGRSIKKWTKRK